MQNCFYDELHNLYEVSKTLRFELVPQGKTKENIEKEGILKIDEYRNEIFKKVKKYCDEYHKYFIDLCLSGANLKNLGAYYKYYSKTEKTDEDKQIFEEIQGILRKEIINYFKNNKDFDILFSEKLINFGLTDLYKDDPSALEEIKHFEKFTTYFTGYYDNRKNMYSDEAISTSIAYRLINENLPIFIKNLKTFEIAKKKIPNEINEVFNNLKDFINIDNIDEIFTLEHFNKTLTQKDIETYNNLIGGISKENNIKIKGLNECINLYNQKTSEKLPKLQILYKQILSDTDSISFKLETIENDIQLNDELNNYNKLLIESFKDNQLLNIFEQINTFDLDKIYINNDLTLTKISKNIFNDWNYINIVLENNFDKNYTGKTKQGTEKYIELKKGTIKKNKVFSIKFLEDCINEYEKENTGKIANYFKEYINKNLLIQNIYESYKKYQDELYSLKENEKMLSNNKVIESVKNYLDSIKILQDFIKIFIPKDNAIETDERFYSIINEKYFVLSKIIPLYNKTRNYLTKKPYSTEKIKINFDCSTLLSGWDLNKVKDNLGVLFIKDNKYYLGIINPKHRKIFDNYQADKKGNNYKKIEYKLLPGPNKMLPKVFFAKSRIDEFDPSAELLEKYKKGCHKKGADFDINFCHELIDFYKSAITLNADWQSFDFNFSPTETYKDISGFYKEVEQQGYKLVYKDISVDYINSLVNEGKLYLFQIYNKDFSEFTKGKPNLHTMYFRAVFDENNLKDTVYKLNGGAEIFYRKASIPLKDAVILHKNSLLENKNPNIVKSKPTTILPYDIIKDRRFTVDKFQFHVPITLNFKNQGLGNINELVNSKIKTTNEIYSIGIDRGERNLLYVCVVNSKGEIVHQQSLNEIINEYNGITFKTDYHKLLDNKEDKRDKARKNWTTIENIKELKEGYLSQVIHKIVELTEKYNAIIVIEDLNMGFKNSRTKVEKQVYQKFESMLINKLNYLVFKEKEENEPGGLYKAYQLTNKFDSFKKLGKQTGILFYIPAWCTSKIDPVTGFVNLFNTKYENLNKAIDFVKNFEEIRFNGDENYFEFIVDDYSKFTDRLSESKKDWVICSNSDRILTYRNPDKNNEWDSKTVILTDGFKNLFEKYNISLKNIKSDIIEKADAKFFNGTKEKDGFIGFMHLFKLVVQMRNSNSKTSEDYIISPVKNKNNEFYDSRICSNKLPKDADANGAYNIARKGLMLIEQIKNTAPENPGKIKYNITNKEWLKWVQKNS